jgi:hypothetical protein
MVVGGSLSDFSLGASYANGLMSAYGTKQTCSMRCRMSRIATEEEDIVARVK